MKRSIRGFAAVELVLVVVAIAIIGYVFVQASHKAKPASVTSTTAPTVPAVINSAADLTAAEQQLNSQQLDAATSDEQQLQADVGKF